MLNRRGMLSGMAAGAVVASGGCARPAVSAAEVGPRFAVTIDDFRFDESPRMDGAARHRAILDALDAAGIQAAGLITGKHVDDATAATRLAAWAEAGHAIGNHTYSHAYYGGANPGDLGADIDRVASLLSGYATVRPWFRFPYLAEGRTVAFRDRMRGVLRERGLSNAHVTIDASDWYVNQRLLERLKVEPGADVAPYGDYLVRHLLDRARFYDGLAREVVGYSPPHTLLIHHNLTTALFLPRVLTAFGDAGWTAIDADTAFAHPIYQTRPDIAPAAHSLIWQLAKADGRFEGRLREPGEDGPYEKPAMDALGL